MTKRKPCAACGRRISVETTNHCADPESGKVYHIKCARERLPDGKRLVKEAQRKMEAMPEDDEVEEEAEEVYEAEDVETEGNPPVFYCPTCGEEIEHDYDAKKRVYECTQCGGGLAEEAVGLDPEDIEDIDEALEDDDSPGLCDCGKTLAWVHEKVDPDCDFCLASGEPCDLVVCPSCGAAGHRIEGRTNPSDPEEVLIWLKHYSGGAAVAARKLQRSWDEDHVFDEIQFNNGIMDYASATTLYHIALTHEERGMGEAQQAVRKAERAAKTFRNVALAAGREPPISYGE